MSGEAIVDEPLGFEIPKTEDPVVEDDYATAAMSIYKDKKWQLIVDAIDSKIAALNYDLSQIPRSDYETIGKSYALVETVTSALNDIKNLVEKTGEAEYKRRRTKKS